MADSDSVLEICMNIKEGDDDGYIQILDLGDPPTTNPSDAGDMSLVAEKIRTWKKSELTVAFLDEFPHKKYNIKDMIKSAANEWTQGTSISFKFIEDFPDHKRPDPKDANIRISNRRGGSYSAVGNAATRKPRGEPTMNLDLPESSTEWQINRKAGHEFGHALGFHHEHSSPKRWLRFKEEKVIEHYTRQGYTEEWVQHNILWKLHEHYADASSYDRLSIMHYPIGGSLNKDNITVEAQDRLSKMDKDWVKRVYRIHDDSPVEEFPKVPGRISQSHRETKRRWG